MQKVGGIWSHIIFGRILFEGADPNIHSLWLIKFFAGFFLRELMHKVGGIWSHIIFGGILFEGAEKVGGIWSPKILRWILFEGADAESWRDLEPHIFLPDSF